MKFEFHYSITDEFNKIVNGQTNPATEDQKKHVKQQVEEVYGPCNDVSISPMGYVFVTQDGEVYDVGRIDAKFSFYSK
jgi:glutaminase